MTGIGIIIAIVLVITGIKTARIGMLPTLFSLPQITFGCWIMYRMVI